MGIGKEFLKATAGIDFSAFGRRKGEPQPPLELPYSDEHAQIDLPQPGEITVPPFDLRTAIEQRRSIRSYSDASLTLDELAYLLWCTQGIQEYFTFNGEATKRTVPSSGAKHALETYIAIQRVDGLEPGLYRYIATQHKLLSIDIGVQAVKRVLQAQSRNGFAQNAAVLFVWAARPDVVYWHHGDRGYRNLFLDAGHVGQNLYLACEQIGCGTCELCVFDDREQNEAIGVDGECATAILAAAVGKNNSTYISFIDM